MLDLQTFDIRNFIDRLTPTKRKHRYECPVCGGHSLTIDPKTGAYKCWSGDCLSCEIREAISPWAEVVGDKSYTPPPPLPKPQPKTPEPAPIPSGNIECATLPTKPEPLPRVRRWIDTYEITYQYSDSQRVLRIEKPNGKITPPQHKDANGKWQMGAGDEFWMPYRWSEVTAYGEGCWVLAVEGEKCCEYARIELGLVTFSPTGFRWTEAALLEYAKMLKEAGVRGVISWEDNDDPGRKKAEKLAAACATVGLPFIRISPTRLWPECGSGDDIADWIKWGEGKGIDFQALLYNEIQVAADEARSRILVNPPAIALQSQEDLILEAQEEFNWFRDLLQRVLWQPKSRNTPSSTLTGEVEQIATITYKPGGLPSYEEYVKLGSPRIEFKEEHREFIYKQLVARKYKYVLDTSGTGAGKSRAVGNFTTADFDAAQLFYASAQHRNPTTATIEQWTDLPSRNDGLFADDNKLTPLGKPHVRWPKPGEETNLDGNCHRSGMFRTLANKGYTLEIDQESSENPICQTCSLLGPCRGRDAKGELIDRVPGGSFRRDRAEALQGSDRIRCHLNSLPEASPLGTFSVLEDSSGIQDGLGEETAPSKPRILFVDEVSQQLEPIQWIEVSLEDFDKSLMQIQSDDEEVSNKIKFLLKLRPILNKEIPVTQANYYGYNDTEVRRLLGDTPEGLDEIIAALKKNQTKLSDLLKEADSVSLDGLSAHDRKSVNRKTLKKIRRTMRREAYKESRQNFHEIPANWVAPFLEIISGVSRGAVRIRNGKIIIAIHNSRQAETIKSYDHVFLMDATANRKYIAQHLGIEPERIIHIQQVLPNYENLNIVQVVGFGHSKSRSESVAERLAALKTELTQRHEGSLGAIDYLQHKGDEDGYWFNDNRGSNQYQDLNALLCIGTPYQDIGALQQIYITLTGDRIEKDVPGFAAFVSDLMQAEVIQAVGRLRANRRSDKVSCYLTTDIDLGFLAEHYPGATLTKVEAFTITPRAGTLWQQARWGILQAARQLREAGQKLTQQAIAGIAGISQAMVSKTASSMGGWATLKKLLLSLLESLYSTSNNFSDPLDEEQQWLADSYLPLISDSTKFTPEEAVTELQQCVEAVGQEEFKQILAHTPKPLRVRLLVQLLLAVPGRLSPSDADYLIFRDIGEQFIT